MSEIFPEQPPMPDDLNAIIKDAAHAIEQLDRLYPIEQQGRVVDHMILNPDLYTPEEVLAALDAFKRRHDERSIARPAITTLVEVEQIVNDAGQHLAGLYPEIDRPAEA